MNYYWSAKKQHKGSTNRKRNPKIIDCKSKLSNKFYLANNYIHIGMEMTMAIPAYMVRGAIQTKNVPNCGKSPKGGEGISAKIKIVYISNVDYP